MEGEGEKSKGEFPPLQIDPNRAIHQPTENDKARLDFYTIYEKEASRYDRDLANKCNEELSTTLIFAGLFSAISTAFIIEINSKLEPDPNQVSAVLLLKILLTLDPTANAGEDPSNLSPPKGIPNIINVAAGFMYASLICSLLAAFVAMVDKRRLNLYLLPTSRSTIERCGDRQHKYDELQRVIRRPSKFSSLLLPCSLLFIVFGLYTRLLYINTPAGIVVGFCFVLLLLTTDSVHSPGLSSQTLKDIGSHVAALLLAIVASLHRMWEVVLPKIHPVLLRLPQAEMGRLSRYSSLPIVQPASQGPTSWLAPLRNTWKDIQCKIFRVALRLLHALSLSTVRDASSNPVVASPWLAPTTLATLREMNATDLRCVSWTLWEITDPEALNAAIRLAGTIRWFEDGLDVEPRYDLIVSTLKACFDPTGKLYPGSRDGAYCSWRAILWMHVRAMCRSKEFALKYTLPIIPCDTTSFDDDLKDIFRIYRGLDTPATFAWMYTALPQVTPGHQQWVWNVLLHASWARRGEPGAFDAIANHRAKGDWGTIPSSALLNRLLTWCIFLGWPVDKVALRIQDKSDHSEQVISQLSQAIVSVIRTSHPRRDLLPHMLRDLVRWEQRPSYLTPAAYEWCSVICENYPGLADGEALLFLSLEIGFRHLDPQHPQPLVKLTHTEHHQPMVDIVFDSQDNEVIADLLHAWTSHNDSNEPPPLLDVYTRHLIGLRPSSQRLRRLVIRAVGSIGYQEFERAGVEGFFELLDHLQASVEDMDDKEGWATLLLDIIQSPDGIRHLSHPYWESLAELSVLESQRLEGVAWSPHIMVSLESNREWDRLEAWTGILWMVWPPEVGSTTEEDVRGAMLSLFRQQPGAIQKLEQWMEQWGERRGKPVPESFQQICEQARPEVAQH